MRALPSLLLVLALLAPLAPAGADGGERAYSGQASSCDLLRAFGVRVGPPCPWVRQEGFATPTGCDPAACTLRVQGIAEGGGVPTLRKTLLVEVVVDGAVRAAVCAADAAAASLACGGAATVALPVAPGECIHVRVRATLMDLADVPPSFTARAETAYEACHRGAALDLE